MADPVARMNDKLRPFVKTVGGREVARLLTAAVVIGGVVLFVGAVYAVTSGYEQRQRDAAATATAQAEGTAIAAHQEAQRASQEAQRASQEAQTAHDAQATATAAAMAATRQVEGRTATVIAEAQRPRSRDEILLMGCCPFKVRFKATVEWRPIHYRVLTQAGRPPESPEGEFYANRPYTIYVAPDWRGRIFIWNSCDPTGAASRFIGGADGFPPENTEIVITLREGC